MKMREEQIDEVTQVIELTIDSSKGVAFVVEDGEERYFGSKASDWESEFFMDQHGVLLSKRMVYSIIGRDEDKESK